MFHARPLGLGELRDLLHVLRGGLRASARVRPPHGVGRELLFEAAKVGVVGAQEQVPLLAIGVLQTKEEIGIFTGVEDTSLQFTFIFSSIAVRNTFVEAPSLPQKRSKT